jgi:hypothetical protein
MRMSGELAVIGVHLLHEQQVFHAISVPLDSILARHVKRRLIQAQSAAIAWLWRAFATTSRGAFGVMSGMIEILSASERLLTFTHAGHAESCASLLALTAFFCSDVSFRPKSM